MPKLHSEWAQNYPWIYYLNIQLFEFKYKFKSAYKFCFNDICLYQIMGFDVEKCILVMVSVNYNGG
jgi:hypothetical protein